MQTHFSELKMLIIYFIHGASSCIYTNQILFHSGFEHHLMQILYVSNSPSLKSAPPPPTGISTPNTAPPSALVLLMYNDTSEYSFEGLQ